MVAPLITVSVPTYRRPSLLLQCLRSVFQQNYRPLEIDVSDNSSTDEAEQLIAGLTPPEGITIRYWRNVPASNLVGNINKLFAEARGERLLVLHDDDALLPGAIEALDEAYRSSPDVICAYGIQECITPFGMISPKDTETHSKVGNRTSEYSGLHYDLLVRALWRQVPCDGFLIDTRAARQIGYRSMELVGLQLDTDFGIRLSQAFPGKAFYFVDRKTSLYRLSPEGLRETGANVSSKIYDVLEALPNLSPAEMAARDRLMHQIAAESVVEHAMSRRRKKALHIFFSRYYRQGQSLMKSAYHLGLIATPRLRAVRYMRSA